MARKWILSILALCGLVALTLAVVPQATQASSHREAPLITKDPTADNTDVYAFVSPDKSDTVTIIANYIPLEEPNSGPYFYNFDDDVLYEIHIDNNGDAKDDITYQFRFTTKIRNPNTYLYNTGPITSLNDKNWNYRQFYRVTRVGDGGDDTFKRSDDDLPVAPANIGPRSTPNYNQLAAAAVKRLDHGVTVFAGPRDDPFFIDVGPIFDLGGLRPFNSFHVIPLPNEPGVDGLSGFNTHSIAIQVPIKQLTHNHKKPKDAKDPNAVIGIYASASRQSTSVLRKDGTTEMSGPYVQVSRLGEPLINEVIIPVGKKDYWNRQDPADDQQFQQYYEKPELAKLINMLYPALPDTPTSGRTDLVQILLTGVPGLNFTGKTPADLLRLNMGIPPAATPNRLGVPAGDLAGFPNGRRLTDDVVDIELRAVACGYGEFLGGPPPGGAGLLKLCNLSPNNTIGDGVDANDVPFLSTFPYVGTPHQGYDHTHEHGNMSHAQ